MKIYEKKEILGNVTLQGAHRLRVVAIATAKETFTAYIGPSLITTPPEKPTKEEKAKSERLALDLANGLANRGSILEKDQALGFFPKLKRLKYTKKVLNEDFQK